MRFPTICTVRKMYLHNGSFQVKLEILSTYLQKIVNDASWVPIKIWDIRDPGVQPMIRMFRPDPNPILSKYPDPTHRFWLPIFDSCTQEDRLTIRRLGLKLEARFSHTSHVVRNHLLLVGGVGIRESPGLFGDFLNGWIFRFVRVNLSPKMDAVQ